MSEPVEENEKAEKAEEIEEAKEAKEAEVAEEAETAEEEMEEIEEEEILEEAGEEEIEAKEEEKKEVKEKEIVEEKIYTIPLSRAWISPRKKRAPRAVRLIKSFIQRHMKPEVLVVDNEVNERIWSRGIQKPPRNIRVRAVKDREGTVTLYLAEGD